MRTFRLHGMALARCLLALATVVLAHAAHAAGAPFEDSMAQRLRACSACHGEQGKAGPDGYYPRLAGKPAGYLFHQLQNFRAGRRHYPLMLGLIDTLDDAYLQDIAQHFSSLSVPYPPPKPSSAPAQVLAQGRALVQQGRASDGLPACVQCHGAQLTGVSPDIPGLLGLPADYLNAQLGGWQSGQRRAAEPDCMAQIAKQLSLADIHAIAQWLSSQVVPLEGHPATQRPALPPGGKAIRCGSAP